MNSFDGEAYKHKLNFDHFRNIDGLADIAVYVPYPRNFVAKSEDGIPSENMSPVLRACCFTTVLAYVHK